MSQLAVDLANGHVAHGTPVLLSLRERSDLVFVVFLEGDGVQEHVEPAIDDVCEPIAGIELLAVTRLEADSQALKCAENARSMLRLEQLPYTIPGMEP